MPDEKTDLLPSWAVNLTVQIAELNAKLGPHTDWVERNVKDHETRIRALEQANSTNSWLFKVAWVFVGAAVPLAVAFLFR